MSRGLNGSLASSPEAKMGEERECAREPGLLGERGEDEVAPDDRDAIGHAVAESGAEESSVAEREEALDHLVAGAEAQLVGERSQPDVDPCLHVIEELVRDQPAEHEQPE